MYLKDMIDFPLLPIIRAVYLVVVDVRLEHAEDRSALGCRLRTLSAVPEGYESILVIMISSIIRRAHARYEILIYSSNT